MFIISFLFITFIITQISATIFTIFIAPSFLPPTGGMCLGFMGDQMEFSSREYKGDRAPGMTFIKILSSETEM